MGYGQRDRARRYYGSVTDALNALRVRDLHAQDVVRCWLRELVRSDAWRQWHYGDDGGEPWGNEPDEWLDPAWSDAPLALWMVESDGYLGIGTTRGVRSSFPADGRRLLARVYRSHVRVLETPLTDEGVLWFANGPDQGERPSTRGRGGGSPVCPVCNTTLPRTGVCDNCS